MLTRIIYTLSFIFFPHIFSIGDCMQTVFGSGDGAEVMVEVQKPAVVPCSSGVPAAAETVVHKTSVLKLRPSPLQFID